MLKTKEKEPQPFWELMCTQYKKKKTKKPTVQSRCRRKIQGGLRVEHGKGLRASSLGLSKGVATLTSQHLDYSLLADGDARVGGVGKGGGGGGGQP